MVESTSGSVVVAVCDDDGVRASLRPLAALAGMTAELVAADELRARWVSARAVVVDASVAGADALAGLPRRSGVLVVTPGEPSMRAWQVALALGAEAVLALPREEQQLLDWLACLDEPSASARVVMCLPARGGCGSSTLAAGFALAAGERGHDVLLLDADVRAGGNELLVGTEQLTGSRWDAFVDASGVLSATVLADALPRLGRVRVLSCTRGSRRQLPAAAVAAVLAAGRRGHELVVVDASSCDADVVLCATAVDVAIVTVPAEVRAVTAAAALVDEVRRKCADVRLVVRHPGPGGLRPRDVGEAVAAPVAAVWPHDRRLARLTERGGFGRGWRHTNVARVAGVLLEQFGAGE